MPPMPRTRLSRCRGFFVCVRKSIKVLKKGMLSLDFFGLSLDLVWTKSGLGGCCQWTVASYRQKPGWFVCVVHAESPFVCKKY